MKARITNAFAKAKAEGRGAFVAYLTMGYPSIAASEQAVDDVIAGGADVILLPEIPYDIDKVIDTINHRDGTGSRFSIIVAAEGAISKEDAKLPKKKYKKKVAERGHSVAYEIAKDLSERTGREIRVAVPGHTQRGGAPCAYDRVFATQVGVEAARGILDGEWGFMVADKDRTITRVPLDIVAGRLKTVDPECQLVQQAKLLGISFGA